LCKVLRLLRSARNDILTFFFVVTPYYFVDGLLG
jgi:hypothetical protein